ncbi:trypsin epsilon [Eurytemora carolleeae]|uniref:trypsin epsilon n=1 Tax=Eurytemora carolleeae TaxID=1294199 RepID=UPI000C782503|nr:trypsin epsilon [Eurytemora carolleeae]|eukprot:XP_023334767.1 trypsin epsilon-like [Eurytemora affinis]
MLFVRDPVLNVQPISLIHPRAELPPGSTVIALGWGRTNSNSKGISSVLQEVDLMVSPCTSRERKTITETAFCTRTPSKDTCNGDSGGPIVIQVLFRWV